MKKTVFEKYFLKTCSVITAACFLLTAIGGNLSASAVPSGASDVDAVFDNLNIISPEYGKITSVSDTLGDITVINIQDLHCHERTQRNISEIIKTLDKKYKLKSVFVEGGNGPIDISWIDKIQDANAKQLIIEQMIKEGYLTGAEYYAIKNNKYGFLKGIEDKNTHERNLKRLSLIIENQKKYKSLMLKINNEIEVLDNIYLNDRNKRFSLKINRYKAGQTDSLKYYRMLVKYAGKIKNEPEKYNNIVSINLEDYPNILGYIDLSRYSKNINPVKASAELQMLVNTVKNKIPYSSYRKLVEQTDNFRDTQALTDFLVVFCRMNNINLSKEFKDLNAFFEVSALSNRINPVELVNEERTLTEQIRMALSYDATEYEIAYINDFSKYFGDYLSYSLTSSDWNYFKLNFAKFRQIYSKYASVDRINEISDDIALLNQYYDTNDLRNDIFVSNILKDEVSLQNGAGLRTYDDILKQSKEVIVVVSGGYHSQSLQSIFSSKNINSMVITPNVTGDVSKADDTYGKIIKEQSSVNSNALAFKLASCLSDLEQKSLLAKMAIDALGIENAEKLKNMIGADIDLANIKTEVPYSDKQKKINEIIKTAVNAMVSTVPQDGGRNIFNPDIDNILIEMSLKLYDMGFYFENGTAYEIDSSEYKDKDLLGIPAEVYSRMFAGLQKGLLAVQRGKYKKAQLSIFDALKNKNAVFSFLAKTAPVWEEILFRAVPSLIMVFNPVLGILLFAVSQVAFLFSHTIVKWLVNRDAAGNRQKFSSILEHDFKNLSIPALAVALPYILTAGAPVAFLPVITLASIVIHYFYNRNNPGNPIIIFSGINGLSPENIIKTLHDYAVVYGYYDFVKERLNLLDKNLAAYIIEKSDNPQQTALNMIDKIKYIDPALLNGLESYDYALDIFDLDPFMLDYIRDMGFDGYKFNLFMKLRHDASIHDKEYMNVWLANTIRGDSRFRNLDKATVRGLATILAIYGPKENIETIEYLFKQMFEAESFDFGQFFKMTVQFNLTQNTDKLKLLQISFDNGFQNDAPEILDFSEQESSAIAREIALNENKTTILNVRLFSALKDMADADTTKFLARYCFGKGNIIEKRKMNENIDEETFMSALKALLEDPDRDNISVDLMADFTASNIKLDENQTAQILELLKELTKMEINNLATENGNLALRVFLSQAFADSFDGKVSNKKEFKNIDNIIQRYRRAIAVSVFMTKLLDGKTELLNPDNFDKITAVASDAYFSILSQWFNKELTDQDSFVTAVFHDESAELAFKDVQGDRFDPAILKKFLSRIGIDADNSKNVDLLQRSKDPGVKIKLFDRIINAPKNGKKSLFWMHGHGSKDGFYITDTENITFQEFANALYTASKLGVDLKAVTFVFNSCHSGDFKDKILKELESKGVKDSPVIITIAGHETELGYTEKVKYEGEVLLASNLEFSIFNLFESVSNTDLQNKNLLLGDFILAQNDVRYSNPTISIPATADVKNIIENAKKAIRSNVVLNNTEVQPALVKIGTSVALDASMSDKKKLPLRSVELSLLKPLNSKSKTLNVLSKAAPVWEELIFRMIPSIITVFNPVLGISLFAVSQIVFLFSHTIVKWIVNKDSAGGIKFIDILKDDLSNLSLPTLAVSLPYILVMSAAPVLWPLSTATAVIIHSFFNDMSILKSSLNAGFEIKLPVEQMGGIKEGDLVLVTYISNDTVLVSRNGVELQEFCRIFAEKYTDNEEQKIIEALYPKTFEFRVGSRGIVNIKRLAKSLSNPLALIPQQNLNIGYKPVLENTDENNTGNAELNEQIADSQNNAEEQTATQQNNIPEKEYASVDADIENELLKRLSPEDVVELNFSEFINEKEAYDIAQIEQYVNDVLAGRDLSDSMLTIKFSDSYVDISDEIKIKKAADILCITAEIIDEKFADRMGSSRGYTFFPELLENSFVHGNYLSLNKKIFVYFGSDKDVVVINANTPNDRTIAALAAAGKLDLYGDGSGMLSAERVNGAKYAVTDLKIAGGSTISLFLAYMTFKKYAARPSKFLKKILNKINIKAIWNTAETGNIEREYSYVEIPDIREGQTIKAGNFIAGQMWYFCDWIEFSLSKINGRFVITEVNKTLNQNKIHVEKIKLEEKLDIVSENGKFYIRSDYTGIKFLNNENGMQYADTKNESSDAEVEEKTEESAVPYFLQNRTSFDVGFEIVAGQINTPNVRGQEIGSARNLDYRKYLKRLYDRMTDTFNFDQLEIVYKNDLERLSLIKHLKLLKLNNSADTTALMNVLYDNTADVKHRLAALMYLKMNGFSKFNYMLLENVKNDFLKLLRNNALDVKNNFDLSAAGAGILLVLSDYLKAEKYIDENKERELYAKISYSIFVSKNGMRNFAANAGMFFTNADPLTIAHEIGHRILMFFADAGQNVSYSTLHEIFANAISAIFAQKAGIENKTYSDSLYELFNGRMNYDYIVQEEHKASSGLFYLAGQTAAMLGKQFKFELLADAVVKMLSTNRVLPERQSDTLKELLKEYKNILKSRDGYSEEETAQFELLLKEESWKTKVFEIFMALKNANGTRWDYYGYRFESIMNQIRVNVEHPESYLHGPLGLDYSNDLVVINNIIISQPEKINEVLEIVRAEFLNDGRLLRSEIIKLVFIELMLSMPQLKELTKQQIDIIMQHIADEFFMSGSDYDPLNINYAEIRKSALVEYHLFKMFQPREINKKDSAIAALLKRNVLDDTYSAARDDRYTSKTLPSFIPTIDSFFMVVGYRSLFDFVAGRAANGPKQGIKPEIKKYLNIIRGGKNNTYLLKILYGWDLPLQHRLFAAMYLKINGYDLSDHSGVLDNIKREFIVSLRNGTFKVDNNFDLRAMCTGVFLSIENFADNFIESRDQQHIYKKISKAVIVRRGNKQTAANNAFHFVYYDPFTIAHEIGHNILSALKFYGSNATALTIHELFAEITSNVFGGEISEYRTDQNAALYDLFNETFDYEYIFQEEHKAARGFTNLIINASHAINRHVKWVKLAEVIADMVSDKTFVKQKQAYALKSLALRYFEETKADNYVERILSEDQTYTAVNDILAEIKKQSPKRYAGIIARIKQDIEAPKSYRYAKKSKLDYDNDNVFINNVILSQPYKIYDILAIIRSEILLKFYFNRTEMEILTLINIMLKYNINRTRKIYLRNEFIKNVNKLPKKQSYDMNDYYKMENYINGNVMLTMDWLNKLLLMLGKKDFSQRQKMVSAIEYPLIILGMFFPAVRNWFLNKHKTLDRSGLENKLSELEKTTSLKIKEVLNVEISAVLTLNFVEKLILLSKIITNNAVKIFNKQEHLKLNLQDSKINIIFQDYKLQSVSSLNPDEKNSVNIFITDNVRRFKEQHRIINTGLAVNGKTVWQIDIDGMLVFGTDNADNTDTAEALFGSRMLEKRIKAFMQLKKNAKIDIDSAVIVDEKTEEMYFKGKTAIIGEAKYAGTAVKILNSISFMYAQKTIISLENISNGNLYSALSNGAVRKAVTVSQFEYLKNKFNAENKNIALEFLKLRKQGIEIYIIGESDVNAQYKDFSVSGQILENKIYDYYSGNYDEVEAVKEIITPAVLKSKIINSDKPLLIDINLLKKMFSGTNDIMETYDGFSALLGSIKIKFGFKDVNIKDMANFAYSLDMSEIPVLDDITDIEMVNAGVDNFADIMKLDSDNAVRIILQDAKINRNSKDAFLLVIKERVLAKTKLAAQNKENGLKDKKLEILLGKVLIMRVNNQDKDSLLPEIELFKGSEQDMAVKVNKLFATASADKNPEALNTIVELIIVYGEDYKTREIIRTNEDKMTAYRTMLAAA